MRKQEHEAALVVTPDVIHAGRFEVARAPEPDGVVVRWSGLLAFVQTGEDQVLDLGATERSLELPSQHRREVYPSAHCPARESAEPCIDRRPRFCRAGEGTVTFITPSGTSPPRRRRLVACA